MADEAVPDTQLQEAKPPPDPAQRPCLVSGILHQGQEEPVTLVDMIRIIGLSLAGHVRHIAEWTAISWKIGDFNQYQLVTVLDDGLELIHTLSSEPQEDVHWRVAVRSNGTEVAAFDRSRRERLSQFGFSPAGDLTRWERFIRVSSSRDAVNATHDFCALLVDGFGWSGRSNLSFSLVQGQRAESGQTYRNVSPEDLRKLLHAWGYRAELSTNNNGNPVIRSGASGYKFHILFSWPAKDARLYGCISFVTVFTTRFGLTVAVVNDINRSSRFARLYMDDDGDLILERDVSLTGGVTTDYLHECLLDWISMMESVFRKVEKLTVPSVVVH